MGRGQLGCLDHPHRQRLLLQGMQGSWAAPAQHRLLCRQVAKMKLGFNGVDSVASVEVKTAGADFIERVLRCNSSLESASRFSSQEEHIMS